MNILGKILSKLFGTQQERDMKRYMPIVTDILERIQPELAMLSDDQLRAKTGEFRQLYATDVSLYLVDLLQNIDLDEVTVPHLRDLLKDLVQAEAAERVELFNQLHRPFSLKHLPGPDRMQLDELHKKFIKARFRVLEEILPDAFAVCREMATRIGQPERWAAFNVPYNRLLPHYPVQLVGGMSLFEGCISEMATGEGKTIVATLPAYLIGITGEGVHIVTVNDYLAKRDSEWMGPLYRELGLTVGTIQTDMEPQERRIAYAADITYGTNNEYGFDYLRDNMAWSTEHCVQRELNYAIVDEVDSILIDEARTPLIISGPAEESTDKYYRINAIIPRLTRGEHFIVDEKEHTVMLTEEGIERAQQLLGLENMFTEENLDLIHHINQAVRAHTLYQLDTQYIIQEGKVVIVDEFTGRLMAGRRWSDGLHQAVEAKEGLKIERENQTLATITFQNYFRLYDRIAGMTGTADTEAAEFQEIYKLGVRVIPTNRPMSRVNYPDAIYKTEREKFEAIVEEIVDCHDRGQPVLVGTISIEASERLSKMLKESTHWNEQLKLVTGEIIDEVKESFDSETQTQVRNLLKKPYDLKEEELDQVESILKRGDFDETMEAFLHRARRLVRVRDVIRSNIPHNILNAKQHQREAEIIAQAGSKGMVTISTNMAGRGTDIVLGGNPQGVAKTLLSSEEKDDPEAWVRALAKAVEICKREQLEVVEVGGLHVLGTERHESRRIDNQLRGRSGRQGDPGSSRFFLSLEDDLMRKFGSDRIKAWAVRLGMREGEVIENRMVSRAIETAQKRVEAHHFDVRKHLLKYDNVMGKQREVIYERRRDLLAGEDPVGDLFRMVDALLDKLIEKHADATTHAAEFNLTAIQEAMAAVFGVQMDLAEFGNQDFSHRESAKSREALRERIGELARQRFEERKEEIGEQEYSELISMIMLRTIDSRWKEHLYAMDHLRDSVGLRGYAQKDPLVEYEREAYDVFEQMFEGTERDIVTMTYKIQVVPPEQRQARPRFGGSRPSAPRGGGKSDQKPLPPVVQRTKTKVGRNDLCPCGSGKKYKKCCSLE